MNRYDELRAKMRKEFNEFPVEFAFSQEEFNKGMKNLGLKVDEFDKITEIGFGGFIRTSDVKKYVNMHKRHNKELKEAIKNDKTGEGFIKDMFYSELVNNEYGYTSGLDDILEIIGYTIKEINCNKALKRGLELAVKQYEKEEEEELY